MDREEEQPETESVEVPSWYEEWADREPPRRSLLVRLVAAIALLAFVIAFPLSTVVDGFSRGNYPELAIAVVEMVFVGAAIWWLRSWRRGQSR